MSSKPSTPHYDNLPPDLRRRIPSPTAILLEAAIAEALDRGLSLYLVGGAVRDWIRDHAAVVPLADLDLALDGHVEPLARAAAARCGARVTTHQRFDTATLELRRDVLTAAVDIARTRAESYPRPAVLPVTAPAPILEDVARRDFTINAMVYALSGPYSGGLLDPYEGQRHLREGLIQVIHGRSFLDDPTRLIRACRYAARIGGRLERRTRRLAIEDREGLKRLSPQRFGEAWRQLLHDPAAGDALKLAFQLKLPQSRADVWRPPPAVLRAWRPWREADPAEFFWALNGMTVPWAGGGGLEAACGLRRNEAAARRDGGTMRWLRAKLNKQDASVSQIAGLLRPIGIAALAAASELWQARALGLTAPTVAGNRVEAFVDTWKFVEPVLSAGDLRELGVPQGPAIGAWLEAIRDATLDDRLPRDPALRGTAIVAERSAAIDWLRSTPKAPPRRPRRRRKVAGETPQA